MSKTLIYFLLILLSFEARAHAAQDALTASLAAATPTPKESFTQFFSFAVGPYTPESLIISNGTYNFNYNNSASTFLVEAGWGIRLLKALRGSFYLEENVAFTTFTGKATSSVVPMHGQSFTVNFVGLDSRLMYAWEDFVIRSLIPFVDGGYQFMLYNQVGPADLSAAQGSIGNPTLGLGLRWWVNSADASDRSSMPFFVSAKFNRIFPAPGGLNLAGSLFQAGLSVGI